MIIKIIITEIHCFSLHWKLYPKFGERTILQQILVFLTNLTCGFISCTYMSSSVQIYSKSTACIVFSTKAYSGCKIWK